MKAVVFGKFPQQFVHDRIVPQLEKLGIEVLSFDTNPAKFAKANLEGVDVVFFLSELAAHKEQDQIRQSIRRYNTKLVYLSRKTSLWPEQFQRAGLAFPTKEDHDMARPVIVKNLDAFLRKYIELKERNFSLDDMVPTLRDMFPTLKDGKHLSSYISRLRTQTPEKLPQFFVQYEAGNGVETQETHNHESPPSSAPVAAEPKGTDEDLLQLADQEIQEHKKEIDRLSAALKDANKALDELKKKTNGTLKENVTLIRRGIKTGLFTPDEGLAKLEALLQ